MSHKLDVQIQHARSSLRSVSPLPFWVVLVMAIFNLLLGASFVFSVDSERVSAPLLIVNEIFTYQFWGIVFMSTGLLKLWALKTNNWALTRGSLLVGVSVKAAWTVALTIRTIVSPGTVFLNLLWITIALLQMGTYIWFMPPASGENYRKKDSE